MTGIVMLVNEFSPLPIGGAEQQAERLSRYLAANNWQVKVITRGTTSLPKREQRSGFEIIRIRSIGPGKIKSLVFVLGTIWTLWKLHKDYSLLHAHLAFGPAMAATLMGRLLHKPVIVKFGNSGPFGDIQTSQRTLRGRVRLAMIRHWANMIIVLDAKLNAEALSAGFSQTRYLPNGIDPEHFKPCQDKNAARANLGLSGHLVLVFTGRLDVQKSVDILLQALKTSLGNQPNLHLVIVGDGPERQKLELLTGSMGLSTFVTYTGNQVDVRPYLDAADIFILPSMSEGISNSLLEAMAQGLACIATSVGGTPEVLGNCGLLVEPGDPGMLSRAILQYAADLQQANHYGELARKKILEEYDFEITGKAYIDLYSELL